MSNTALHHRVRPRTFLPACLTVVVASLFASTTVAQYAERPHLAGSGEAAVDVSGRSVKNMRVRAIHTDKPRKEGGTAYFLSRDPFLAYQLGRNLNFREFRSRDGIFDANVSSLAGPMPDGTTAKITANNQVSCSGCHNLPQGNPGGGVSFHKDAGTGRNTPHYFGAGLMEMLALQIRADILRQVDTDGSGWISAAEASAHGSSVQVECYVGGPMVDFGDPSLSRGAVGSPSFNNIVRVWYVDAQGRVVDGATEIDGKTTFGYNFSLIVWGWGQGEGRSALNPTNRAFLWDPWKAHGGLESHDPTTLNDRDGDGVSLPSISGAIQFPATHQAPDAGTNLDPLGFSRDDPDEDGYLTEISEGDLDLAEWFMLNAPRPAFAGTAAEFSKGLRLLEELSCTTCHVGRWDIRPRDGTFEGDRRLFDFDVRWNRTERQLQGKLVRLYDERGGQYQRHFDGFPVLGLFTDFRHHDLGDDAAEVDFGGTVNRLWRTAPLWGVGSGFPWMHDGQSLTLHDAIMRHGGAAERSRTLYQRSSLAVQRRVVRFLEALVLYDIESIPADIDDDGAIAQHFHVQGVDTGVERFNAEWLFRNPVEIQGLWVNGDGERVRSFAATNVDEAYGQLLPYRLDSDADGWPDVWDHAPFTAGYKDGEQN